LLSTVNVFPLPLETNGAPIDVQRIQTLGDNLYFTTRGGDIGRMTLSGQVTRNFAPGGADLAVGTDGNLWTADGNLVWRITPSGTVTKFQIPAPSEAVGSIAAATDGGIWFEEESTGAFGLPSDAKLGRLDPATGAVTEFTLPPLIFYTAPEFGGMTAGPNGSVDFTSPLGAEVGKVTPTGAVTFTAVDSSRVPEQIAAGPDGALWFTSYGAVGRIAPTGQFTEFALPTNGSQLSMFSGITVGPDGNTYFNTSTGLGRITPTGDFTENVTPLPGGDAVAVGPDGNIWASGFHDDVDGMIGQLDQLVLGGNATSPASTTTALAASAGSTVFGQKVTLTATVNSTSGTPQGTVTFYDGKTAVGSGTLSANGQATLSVSLGVGSHSLTASFAATKSYAASKSASVLESVKRAKTTTTLSASATSVARNQSVVLTATIAVAAPGSGAPTGAINFFDGSTLLGTAQVNSSGQAVLTIYAGSTVVRNGHHITLLGPGSHHIVASYSGDANFSASFTAALGLLVT
jgi:streptogramin lyase